MPIVYGAGSEEEFHVSMPSDASMMSYQLGLEHEDITESIVLEAYLKVVNAMRFEYGSPRDLKREIGKLNKVRDFFLDYIYRACVESTDENFHYLDYSYSANVACPNLVELYCSKCNEEQGDKELTRQELIEKLDYALVQKRSEFAGYPNRLAFLDRAEAFLKKKLPLENSNVNS